MGRASVITPPAASIRPTGGWALFAAGGAGAGLRCPALWRNALPTGDKKRRKAHWGEWVNIKDCWYNILIARILGFPTRPSGLYVLAVPNLC